MSYKLFILLCLLRFSGRAQDTLCKRTGECIAAKVIEIGIADVKFRRLDNLDGPLFVYNKNDIKKIRYASGQVDTFALVKEQPKLPGTQKTYAVSREYNMVIPASRAGTFFYQDRVISDNRLMMMASSKNVTWNSKELDKAIEDTRDAKTLQYSLGFGGLGVGLASIVVLSEADGPGANSNAIAGLAVVSTGLFIATQVMSFHFKVQRSKHARRVADLYNAANFR